LGVVRWSILGVRAVPEEMYKLLSDPHASPEPPERHDIDMCVMPTDGVRGSRAQDAPAAICQQPRLHGLYRSRTGQERAVGRAGWCLSRDGVYHVMLSRIGGERENPVTPRWEGMPA
jgi:hypothetical protein